LLCGNKEFLKVFFELGVKQVSDSRITNLRVLKSLNKDIETIYIKPPAKNTIKSVVRYADISLNTEIETIKLLSEEAKRQNRVHQVIIMAELGELREGVTLENLPFFYEKVYTLDNIEIIGIGANLSCLYGVLPSEEKLELLIHHKENLERRFGKEMKYLSGGSSVTMHLLFEHSLPSQINHFRVGETLFFGTDVYTGFNLDELHNDILKLYCQIIEVREKPMEPEGQFGTNLEGNTYEINEEQIGMKGTRAILDIGLLDVDPQHLQPVDSHLNIVGATSDMTIVNLDGVKRAYKVGDYVEFGLDYYSALKLLNSKYVDKIVV
jgi:predicted amino acid racemase